MNKKTKNLAMFFAIASGFISACHKGQKSHYAHPWDGQVYAQVPMQRFAPQAHMQWVPPQVPMQGFASQAHIQGVLLQGPIQRNPAQTPQLQPRQQPPQPLSVPVEVKNVKGGRVTIHSIPGLVQEASPRQVQSQSSAAPSKPAQGLPPTANVLPPEGQPVTAQRTIPTTVPARPAIQVPVDVVPQTLSLALLNEYTDKVAQPGMVEFVTLNTITNLMQHNQSIVSLYEYYTHRLPKYLGPNCWIDKNTGKIYLIASQDVEQSRQKVHIKAFINQWHQNGLLTKIISNVDARLTQVDSAHQMMNIEEVQSMPTRKVISAQDPNRNMAHWMENYQNSSITREEKARMTYNALNPLVQFTEYTYLPTPEFASPIGGFIIDEGTGTVYLQVEEVALLEDEPALKANVIYYYIDELMRREGKLEDVMRFLNDKLSQKHATNQSNSIWDGSTRNPSSNPSSGATTPSQCGSTGGSIGAASLGSADHLNASRSPMLSAS